MLSPKTPSFTIYMKTFFISLKRVGNIARPPQKKDFGSSLVTRIKSLKFHALSLIKIL